MIKNKISGLVAGMALVLACSYSAQPWNALIVDGQNNHDWQATTPVLKTLLIETGLFKVDIATSPPKGQDLRFESRPCDPLFVFDRERESLPALQPGRSEGQPVKSGLRAERSLRKEPVRPPQARSLGAPRSSGGDS